MTTTCKEQSFQSLHHQLNWLKPQCAHKLFDQLDQIWKIPKWARLKIVSSNQIPAVTSDSENIKTTILESICNQFKMYRK